MAMPEGHAPPTLPAGHTAPSGKKSSKKHTAALVIVGIIIVMVAVAGYVAVRNSCTSEDKAMREALLTEMRKKTLLAEAEQAKAQGMIDLEGIRGSRHGRRTRGRLCELPGKIKHRT